MATQKVFKLTPKSEAVLLAMQAREDNSPITLRELNATVPTASANMTQLVTGGYVTAVLTSFQCPTCGAKSERNVYTLTEAGLAYAHAE